MKLDDDVTTIKQINTSYASLLTKLGIFTVRDLLTYFPVKYSDTSVITTIKELLYAGDFESTFQLKGEVQDFKNTYLRGRKSLQEGTLIDTTGQIKCVWFNQKFLQEVLQPGKTFVVSGKLKRSKSGVAFYPSYYEEVIANRELVHLARITPEYALTEGLSKKWLRNRIKYLVDNINQLQIVDELKTHDLVVTESDLGYAISQAHFPDTHETLHEATNTLALYELVNIQLKLEDRRAESRALEAPSLNIQKARSTVEAFIKQVPFALTVDQQTIITNLLERMGKRELLNDLVQGDVGTGKTIVALALALAVASQGYQVAVLAPTTILAKQHYQTFSTMLANFDVDLELVTADNKKTSAKAILIGTSAVIARQAALIKNLGLVVVDEQHKFGVLQREELLKPFVNILNEQAYPHFINMTATPIPRTIAQVFFGDLTINTITSKPKGRLLIKTHLVPDVKREDSYAWIEEQMDRGDQVFWLTPLISESDKIEAASAEEVFQKLAKRFSSKRIALLHGKLKEQEKTVLMNDFLLHRYDILVSTSVIEVGIDVPNATIMVIENAERFGLAQLHQIRGRVGRGEKQSWCFLFYAQDISQSSLDRLKFLSTNSDGLKIADYDLQTRGPGEIYGVRQSGIPFLKIARLDNIEQINESKLIAQKLYANGVTELTLFA